jgi:uncharacterized membrane protein YecN with MAPEG domain
MILPITLAISGAAALVNFWLAWRVGQKRMSEKVLIGDGGNPDVIARMRAHANYVEFTPFVLILIALIELATGTHVWLWIVGAVYLIGRLAHAIGMDKNYPNPFRMLGIVSTMLIMVGLALYAVAIPFIAPAALDSGAEVVDVG